MIHRRDFARLALAASAAPSLFGSDAPKQRTLLKPKRLSAGDTVGMVVPASMVFELDSIDRGRDQLEALGFRVKVGTHAKARHGNLAGTDRDRASDINRFFADEEVKAVVSFSGGWGTPRLLP